MAVANHQYTLGKTFLYKRIESKPKGYTFENSLYSVDKNTDYRYMFGIAMDIISYNMVF